MRRNLYLVRHAEAQSNTNPLGGAEDLTPAGEHQAARVAEYFRSAELDAIWTSKILRARATADAIGGACGITPTAVDCLKERKCAYADATDFSYIEPFDRFLSRLTEARALVDASLSQNLLIVGHAIFLKALASLLVFGNGLDERGYERMDAALAMGHARVSRLSRNAEALWRIQVWNAAP